MRYMHFLLTTVLCLAVSAPAVPSNPDEAPSVIIGMPVDLGSEKHPKKNLWIKTLLAENARFRLGALLPIISDGASTNRPAHILNQTYSLDKKTRTIRYSAGFSVRGGGKKTERIEVVVPFDAIGIAADSCLRELAVRLSPERMTAEARRFFETPALYADFSSNRRLGLLLREQRQSAWGTHGFVPKYRKLLNKNGCVPLFLAEYAETALREDVLPDAAMKKRLFSAALLFENILMCPAGNLRGDLAFRTGMLYEKIDRTFAAHERYRLNLSLFPLDGRNHERLASLLLDKQELVEARAVLSTALSLPSPSPATRKLAARTALSLGEKKNAIALFQIYLRKAQRDADAALELGTLLFFEKQYATAVGPLRKASMKYPDDFDCWYRLGMSLMHNGDMKEGHDALARAHLLSRSHIPTIEALAGSCRSLQLDDELCGLLSRWIVLEPRRADLRLELGALHLTNNRPSEAANALADVSKLLPLDPRPHKLLAVCHEKLGNDALRLSHLEAANRFAEDQWDTWNELGRYHREHEHRYEAIRCFRKVIELNPSYHRGRFELGVLLFEEGKSAKAHAHLRRACEESPDDPRYLVELGRATAARGDHHRAGVLVNDAIHKSPDDPHVLLTGGIVYMEIGKTAEAEQLLERLLAQDSSRSECLVARGDLFLEKGQYTGAAASYFKAWVAGGYSEDVAFKLGRTLFEKGKIIEAKEFFETIITKNPRRADARYWLVASLCRLVQPEKASRVAKGFTKEDGLAWIQLARGIRFEQAGAFDAAAISYAVVDRLDPENVLALRGSARLAAARGDHDSALSLFSAALQKEPLNPNTMLAAGKVFEKLDKTDSALSLYYTIDDRCPDFGDIQAEIARVRSERNEHAAAIAILGKGLKLHPRDSRLHVMLGREYALTDRYKRAIDAYRRALRLSKGRDIEALLQIGNIYYKNMLDSRKAMLYYRRYVKAGGKNETAVAMLEEGDSRKP